MKLPSAFENNMIKMIGEEDFELYKEALAKTVRHALRVNTGKISVEDFIKICPAELTPVPWCKNGFYYDENVFQASKHPYYYAGLYYLQEPSAMLPAATLPVDEGDKVLDICAAPGGKSTELLQKINNKGFLVTNDISASRAKALVKNIEVFGGKNILITCETPDRLAEYFTEYFDKILIDAPCSGEGMFRKKNSMITAWSEERPAEFAAIQRSILKEAVKMLKPGGMLLYSTCTFSPLEDEDSVGYLLSLCSELSLVPIEKHDGFVPGNNDWSVYETDGIDRTMHLFPHKVEGEGHYVALLKRESNDDYKPSVSLYMPEKTKINEETAEFMSHVKMDFDTRRFEQLGDKLFYIPDGCPNCKGLRILRRGMFLGEIKKKRFEPSQAFSIMLTPDTFDTVLDLKNDDIRVSKYLRGETIDYDDTELKVTGKQKNTNRYVLICVDGFSLGFGKLSNGSIKNKYLPGWRMMS
ncbi:NOL1/NOP2/sun family putative RNA methylase [Eubacterium ruminantium]|uniref:NOL1/NOP2/sun family putative RNA methylase n=1 Tax=Eubacterium ruminantium TaxID=42322 RepID=A0A1T4M3F5_9FIRM|nr:MULTISPECIES: RsmB/NOP family class I SAM-dependent RNA methyltransferase [Eubacterium]MCR5367465.1 RsmB/NOP family class I SAM-dependent RNA methyltransferase [Eubacterium sp.]SCW37328.1 NOL1/NOP2/sun family putative RNA methylase [Eubacterium ruminantium]SDM47470.1 NOL1/NOP2/sun family putative RNA methylase [Eubacterium ruminantium]SJZ61493.1 NOL1/NOP2/sun family putative RNA methylase [Eubacterium ruminantium]